MRPSSTNRSGTIWLLSASYKMEQEAENHPERLAGADFVQTRCHPETGEISAEAQYPGSIAGWRSVRSRLGLMLPMLGVKMMKN